MSFFNSRNPGCHAHVSASHDEQDANLAEEVAAARSGAQAITPNIGINLINERQEQDDSRTRASSTALLPPSSPSVLSHQHLMLPAPPSKRPLDSSVGHSKTSS